MKTKKVLEQVELMNESLIEEITVLSDRMSEFNSVYDGECEGLRKQIDNLYDLFNKNNQIAFELHQTHKKRLTSAETSYKTIAKHMQELEEKVDKLERGQKYECHNIGWKPMISTIQIFAIDGKDGKYSVGEKVYPKPQTDYFQKAKNLLIEYAEKTMIKKGIEYTPTGDRFANFRPILGEKKTAIEKLIGYNAKHVQYCFMQNENPSYPSDTYMRENTAIGYIFGFGKDRANWIDENLAKLRYNHWISMQPQVDDEGDNIEYESFKEWRERLALCGQITSGSFGIVGGCAEFNIHENKEYYKQCYIDELLEHWGDVFNYNVLGLAMQNTDRSKAFVVPYADRPTQEKEIKNIVDGIKEINSYNTTLSIEIAYQRLLNSINRNNLPTIIYLFAKQLERLQNPK